MRHSGNIFERESYRGNGIRTVSGVTVVTLILSLISILAMIYVIAHFDQLTASIAIWIARFLSNSFPILLILIIFSYLIMKWRWRRRYWRW